MRLQSSVAAAAAKGSFAATDAVKKKKKKKETKRRSSHLVWLWQSGGHCRKAVTALTEFSRCSVHACSYRRAVLWRHV